MHAEDADPDTFGLFTPDLLSPAQTASLFAARDRSIRAATAGRRPAGSSSGESHRGPEPVAPWRLAADLRKSIHGHVSRIARSTGLPHAQIHNDARRAVPGPATADAGPELLQRRLNWLSGR